MKRINSRQKGARGERQWRDELRANGYQARRGQQFSGSPESPDVVCPDLAGIHFEVKAVERLNVHEAFAQAERDAQGKVPVVAHRRNFWPWLVTMEASVLFNGADGFLNGSSHFVQPAGQRINLHDLVDQASRDAGERPAFVCHQRGDGPRLVTMAAETFFGLLRGTFRGISNLRFQIADGVKEMEGIHGKWEIPPPSPGIYSKTNLGGALTRGANDETKTTQKDPPSREAMAGK